MVCYKIYAFNKAALCFNNLEGVTYTVEALGVDTLKSQYIHYTVDPLTIPV